MENEKTLQLDDAFPEGLPQTIQDAVLLARLLGFSFLWVDVLCICQGRSEADQQDRAVQLGNMVGIYRESNLAVVAACGDSADAGLSGLRPGPRTPEQQVVQVIPPEDDAVYGALALVSNCSSTPPWTVFNHSHRHGDEELERSAWSTRA